MNKIAIFAAGCFWGVEQILREIPGVITTDVGYCGGEAEEAFYEHVKTGNTGHAEAVRIEFNEQVLSYETLLDYFFRLHNPTTLNQQGNDIGTQYRSAIFYLDEEQKAAAQKKLNEVEVSGKWKKPIVTQIVPSPTFYVAESYHQDYLVKNPSGYNCHYLRD
jgi:methionine-S-sulfoxide reductase